MRKLKKIVLQMNFNGYLFLVSPNHTNVMTVLTKWENQGLEEECKGLMTQYSVREPSGEDVEENSKVLGSRTVG